MSDTKPFINESTSIDVTYLTVFEGMLCRKRATPAPGFTKYAMKFSKTTPGKEVYIVKVNSINGYLTNIKKEEKKTMDNKKYFVLIFTFQSIDGQFAKVEVPLKSNFVAAFAKRIESIDLMKPIEFGAFYSHEDRKDIVWFKQNGVKIDALYTKENPRDLPQWTTCKETGEKNASEYWAFLIKKLRDTASVEKLEAVQNFLAGNDEDNYSPSVEEEQDYSGFKDDDIPF